MRTITRRLQGMHGMPALRRLGWGVADQAVSSIENFVLGIYVARSLGAASLGALGLAMLTYAIIVNASRGLSTDALMVRYSGAPNERWRRAVRASSGVALIVGLVSGVMCFAFGALLHARIGQSEVGIAFMALGVGLPGLVVQDSWRYAFFAAGRGDRAFVNDTAWTVMLFVALLVGHLTHQTGVEWAVFVFGGTATLAAVLGVWQARALPSPGSAVGWLRDNRDLGPRFLVENVTLGAGSSVRSYVVAGTSGLAAVGGVRGAEMLIGPVAALLMGIAQVAVPEVVRWLARGRAAFRTICVRLSLGLAAISLAWGVVILAVFPWGIGQYLLGSVWPSAYTLAPAVILSVTFGCLAIGPSAGLRALGRADRTMLSQAVATGLYVGLGSVGAILWGAQGAVWGTAAAAMIGSTFWWYQLWAAYEQRFARGGAAEPARADNVTLPVEADAAS